jgi:PASTA domain
MVAKRALSALRKIGIIIVIAVAFIFGLGGTVYLSLRSPEVKVPDVKGKDRMTAESALDDLGLHMKVRATRFSPDAKPDTILDQLPQKDEVIKVGQTVAVVLARAPKEGEHAPAAPTDAEEKKPENGNGASAQNQNTDTSQTAATNQNGNQNKPKKPKNANNKNANNSNNANSGNRNAANSNAGNRNASGDAPNANRGSDNDNAPKRPTPLPTTPPFVPSRPSSTP